MIADGIFPNKLYAYISVDLSINVFYVYSFLYQFYQIKMEMQYITFGHPSADIIFIKHSI